MSDYIKREDAIKAFKRVLDEDFPYISEETPRERIVAIPSADVVEVVRCKDCKYYKEYIPREGQSAMMCFCPCCLGGQGKKKPTDYCSYGERTTDEHK